MFDFNEEVKSFFMIPLLLASLFRNGSIKLLIAPDTAVRLSCDSCKIKSDQMLSPDISAFT